MAATFTEITHSADYMPEHINGIRYIEGTIAFTSTYTTGGETLTKATVGVPSGATVAAAPVVLQAGQEAGIQTAWWDHANGKLYLYKADGTETANADDHTAVTAAIRVAYTV